MAEETSGRFAELTDIDRLIHEPARLAVMAILYAASRADFLYLQNEIGLTGGNLSAHLSKLEEAGYVVMEKSFENKKPKTLIWLSDEGRQAFQEYKDNLQQIFEGLPD